MSFCLGEVKNGMKTNGPKNFCSVPHQGQKLPISRAGPQVGILRLEKFVG
jgi:hypothetical protein